MNLIVAGAWESFRVLQAACMRPMLRMSFLDNLENSLKNLESREERDPGAHRRREHDRKQALAVAPWAEKLKSSEYTKQLFDKAALAGHRIRAKVYMSWFDATLRLEAKGKRLELKPTAEGVVADYETPAAEQVSEPVDLGGDPDDLLRKWLG
ncbi:MAG: hypothetical protein JO061_03880 [Acidobacteriaceae bacterium]|nr:hypothetical protein [Acidobacteriaceae bacterium]